MEVDCAQGADCMECALVCSSAAQACLGLKRVVIASLAPQTFGSITGVLNTKFVPGGVVVQQSVHHEECIVRV